MFAWFLSTKIGKFLSALGTAVLALCLIFAAGYRKGSSSEEQKQKDANIEAMKLKKEIKDEKDALSAVDLDSYNNKWLRKK